MDEQLVMTRRVWLGRMRNRLMALAIALTLIGMPAVGALGSVEDAGAQGTARISFCVVLPGNTTAADFNVTLYRFNGSFFEPYRYGTSGNGCAAFYSVPVGWTYYLWAQSPSGRWWGYTDPAFYLAGSVSVTVPVHR